MVFLSIMLHRNTNINNYKWSQNASFFFLLLFSPSLPRIIITITTINHFAPNHHSLLTHATKPDTTTISPSPKHRCTPNYHHSHSNVDDPRHHPNHTAYITTTNLSRPYIHNLQATMPPSQNPTPPTVTQTPPKIPSPPRSNAPPSLEATTTMVNFLDATGE